MPEIRRTAVFEQWLRAIDEKSSGRIKVRLDRVADGNFGEWASVGDGVCELRFFFGPGWRVYYTIRDDGAVVLLNGGEKSTQPRDIAKAKALASELKEDD